MMHVKTMEGLIGARTNIELLNTPFRVYKEARLKGDTAMMERAMGYMNDYSKAAYACKEEADEGMKKDAEETRKIAEEQREEAIRKRKEEREKMEEEIAENRKDDINTDTVEISEEGKELLKEHMDPDSTGTDEEPVIYTKTGEASLLNAAQSSDKNINAVSVCL